MLSRAAENSAGASTSIRTIWGTRDECDPGVIPSATLLIVNARTTYPRTRQTDTSREAAAGEPVPGPDSAIH
jgi:hypothetical protein